jgi:UDP-N-acetylglucosamine 4,6-dehydratase/5-epimerase
VWLFDNHSMAARPIFVKVAKAQSHQHNLEPSRKLRFTIGDVRRPERLLDAMTGVDFVFQAAALKQVPSCEFYPMEALLTNSMGTERIS